jgi:Ca2+-binding EF-hand superfamily protein
MPMFCVIFAEEFDRDGDGLIDEEDFMRIMKQSSLY